MAVAEVYCWVGAVPGLRPVRIVRGGAYIEAYIFLHAHTHAHACASV